MRGICIGLICLGLICLSWALVGQASAACQVEHRADIPVTLAGGPGHDTRHYYEFTRPGVDTSTSVEANQKHY